MAYAPNFSNDAKGKYNANLGFVSIKNGTDAYLLEDELNEMQWIQNENRASIIREMTNSGCLQINDFDNPSESGGLQELLQNNINSFGVKNFKAVLNGYLANISKSNSDYITITLPAPPNIINSTRYDFVYLEFWFKEIKPSNSSEEIVQINQYGGIDNSAIPYELIDGRLQEETSHRIQLQWAIRYATINDMDSLGDGQPQFSLGFRDEISNNNNDSLFCEGPNVNASKYVFSVSDWDSNLYIAGNNLNSDLNTVDNYVYAIPLFMVRRINNKTYDAVNNPNGGIDYSTSKGPGNPSNQYANIVYRNQVTDLRVESMLGKNQFDKYYINSNNLEANTSLQTFVDERVTSALGGTTQTDITEILDKIQVVDTNVDIMTTSLTTNTGTNIYKYVNDINTQLTTNSAGNILNDVKNIGLNLTATSGTGIYKYVTDVRTTLTSGGTLYGWLNNLNTTLTTGGTVFGNIATINTALASGGAVYDNINTIKTTLISGGTLYSTINNMSSNIGSIITNTNNVPTMSTDLTTVKSILTTNSGTNIYKYVTDITTTLGVGGTVYNNINTINTALASGGTVYENVNTTKSDVGTIKAILSTGGAVYDNVNAVKTTLANGGTVYGWLSTLNTSLTAGGTLYGWINTLNTSLTSGGTLYGWVSAVNTTLASGGTLYNNINTINTNVNAVKAVLSAGGTVYENINTISSNVNTINTTLASNGTLYNKIDSTNTNVASIKSNVDIVNTNLNNGITSINSQINSLSTSMSNISNNVTGINNKIDTMQTALVNMINSLQVGQNNSNTTLASAINKLGDLSTSVQQMQSQLTQISGNDGIVPTTITYGINMLARTSLLSGGILQPDNSVISSGTSMLVPYNGANTYAVVVTPTCIPEGKLGDLWVEKGSSNFVIKNTGAASVQCDVISLQVDSSVVFTGQANFNGTTGTQITRNIASTDFIVITPLSDDSGTIGEIYIDKTSTSFTVYNTGSAVTNFEWIVIDTTKLDNVVLLDFNLDSLDGCIRNGIFGGNPRIILSTPITPISTIGSIGDVSAQVLSTGISVYNTGASTGRVQGLVFRDIAKEDKLNYNLSLYKQKLYTAGAGQNVNVALPYYNSSDYAVILTQENSTIVDPGELWVQKGNTSLTVNNTGAAGIGYKLITLRNDNDVVCRGVDTFNGLTGKRISFALSSTKWIFITPLEYDSTNSIGRIAVDKNSSDFVVYNSGTATTQFEWVIIDTSKLSNTYDTNLTMTYNMAQNFKGSYGINYEVLISTPLLINVVQPGTVTSKIAQLSIPGVTSKGFDNIGFNDGAGNAAAVGTSRVIVLKDPTPYNFTLESDINTTVNTGVKINVPYSDYNEYAVSKQIFGGPGSVTYTNPSGVGDVWVEKADTSFLLKNSGGTGITINTTTLSVDNDKTYIGNGIFNGSTGTVITRPMLATDFVVITPTNYDGSKTIGSIAITIAGDNSSFTVYNSGTARTNFDWVVIDTTKLRNVDIVNISSLTGNVTGVAATQAGGTGVTVTTNGALTWSNTFDLVIGTPIKGTNWSTVGAITVLKSLNTFTLYNYGGATSNTGSLQCLVFKY